MKKLFLLALLALPTFSLAETAEMDSKAGEFDPKGIWFSGERRSKVEVKSCSNDATKLCGKIIALKEPNDPETKKPKVDLETKEPTLGLEIFKDFSSDGENEWSGGTIRDPKEGKTYSAKFTMKSNSKMDLRGFVGISLLGKTQEWERTTKDAPF